MFIKNLAHFIDQRGDHHLFNDQIHLSSLNLGDIKDLVYQLSSRSWFLMYSLITALSRPTVETK